MEFGLNCRYHNRACPFKVTKNAQHFISSFVLLSSIKPSESPIWYTDNSLKENTDNSPKRLILVNNWVNLFVNARVFV